MSERIKPSDPDQLWARRWVLALLAMAAYMAAMAAEPLLGHEYPPAVYWTLTIQVVAFTAPAAMEAIGNARSGR
ncbi:hypothetical protein [Halorhodospira sp. 9622]|uniref:hypothetical protein n=1 Tax=Halorhodospira sp. 9622 TaxID=2899136 RepID=UPI001EE97BAB|nr:hypothetical protein [Halorhodospira sp. 9622]MCG5538962.1 hypothetical protein [Halorhodospira sp. 9622]